MIQVSYVRGIVALIFAFGVFIASDTTSKFVFGHVPVFELMMLRAVAAALLCLGFIIISGQAGGLRWLFNPLALARGVCEVGANFGFTFGILNLPIGDLTAIAQTAPLFLLLGARVFYGEHLGLSRIVLIAIGIVGAMLVAQPGAAAATPFAFFGFVVAISAACRDLITRKVPVEMPTMVAVLALLLVISACAAVGMLLFEEPVLPSAPNGFLIMLAGGLMVGGNLLIFVAFKSAPARTLAPFMYTLTLWAVAFSYVFFGDVPNALAILGMVLIVAAGLVVIALDAMRSNGVGRN